MLVGLFVAVFIIGYLVSRIILFFFFFSSRRRHTRCSRDWSSDVCSSDLVAVANENYGRLVRMLEKKVPVTLQADIQNKFYDDDLNSFNIIGEIPASEKAKADEIVMIGAHFDSWHSGTGAKIGRAHV